MNAENNQNPAIHGGSIKKDTIAKPVAWAVWLFVATAVNAMLVVENWSGPFWWRFLITLPAFAFLTVAAIAAVITWRKDA